MDFPVIFCTQLKCEILVESPSRHIFLVLACKQSIGLVADVEVDHNLVSDTYIKVIK